MIKSCYVHVPFCKKICSYCDFCKNFYNSKIVSKYLEELSNEIKGNYDGEVLKTLYVGGGTPSCLSSFELNKLFSALKMLKLEKDYEFTFECNYEDITESLLKLLKVSRVNRISIGVQSFNKKYEKLLERPLSKEDITSKVSLAKRYFRNVNVDLMYGFPEQSIKYLYKDVLEFLKLDVSHISTYALMIEPNTKLGVRKVLPLSDDKQAKMYEVIVKTLKEHGYKHYEVSNFAKDGFYSLHNLTYWNNEEYYGFGAGASGFVNKLRYDNTKSVVNYIKGSKTVSEEMVNKTQMMTDEVMLGLRKVAGINKRQFFKKYEISFEEAFNVNDLINMGLLLSNDKFVWIPEDKLFISNEVILRVLDNYRLNK